jgi:hypothetical protein
MIRKRNEGKGIRINTYLYGTRPAAAVKVLRAIAEAHGGVYRYVSPAE